MNCLRPQASPARSCLAHRLWSKEVLQIYILHVSKAQKRKSQNRPPSLPFKVFWQRLGGLWEKGLFGPQENAFAAVSQVNTFMDCKLFSSGGEMFCFCVVIWLWFIAELGAYVKGDLTVSHLAVVLTLFKMNHNIINWCITQLLSVASVGFKALSSRDLMVKKKDIETGAVLNLTVHGEKRHGVRGRRSSFLWKSNDKFDFITNTRWHKGAYTTMAQKNFFSCHSLCWKHNLSN